MYQSVQLPILRKQHPVSVAQQFFMAQKLIRLEYGGIGKTKSAENIKRDTVHEGFTQVEVLEF